MNAADELQEAATRAARHTSPVMGHELINGFLVNDLEEVD